MNDDQKPSLKSKEVQKALKISSCDLMHMRMAGKLRYTKKGNAYLYDAGDVFSEFEKK
ncbi:MAG: hypothetical protein RIC30_15145 [Marinoscillum sp.]|uniref:hypothetical protein n=1 Tax=Marinoscillum sp. TaxID=2024838 RepID=UPI0032F5732D